MGKFEFRSRRAKELLPGGLAKGKKPGDYDTDQLAMGIEVEVEHTDDPDVAQEIAMDHLQEIPDYYTRLEKMEEKAEKEMKRKASPRRTKTAASIIDNYAYFKQAAAKAEKINQSAWKKCVKALEAGDILEEDDTKATKKNVGDHVRLMMTRLSGSAPLAPPLDSRFRSDEIEYAGFTAKLNVWKDDEGQFYWELEIGMPQEIVGDLKYNVRAPSVRVKEYDDEVHFYSPKYSRLEDLNASIARDLLTLCVKIDDYISESVSDAQMYAAGYDPMGRY